MDEDRIAGTATDVTGKLERTVGDIVGDADTKAAGSVRQAAGKVEDLYGQAKDAARDATDAAAGYAKQLYRKVAIARKRLRSSCKTIRLDRC